MRRIEFEVLGPLRVRTHDRAALRLAPTLRLLLGALLCRPNQPVTVDALVDLLWHDQPSGRGKSTLQVHVHRLRALLDDPDRVVHENDGYRLRVQPDELDSAEFERLLSEGREAQERGDAARCASALRQALGRWRGEPFADLDGLPLVRLEAERLAGLRVAATEDRYAAEIVRGRHAAVVDDLFVAVEDNPLRERLAALLMVALHGASRQADALQVYQEARRRLVDDLGLEPGADLRRVHAAILGGDASVDVPGWATPTGSDVRVRPAQLPPDVVSLTGRDVEIGALLDVWGTSDKGQPGTVTVAVIDGMPGVGKTALAVHVAHLLSADFPDGQVFLDLQGFAEDLPVVEPADALERLLRAIGIPGDRIPRAVTERTALWRTCLADRRMLVVLDNAESEAQVRPLLPAAPGCLVLVTSRRRLVGLDDSRSVSVSVLSETEAADLFRRTAGLEVQDDDAVAEVARLCGNLPLAIRLAAGRLRARPACGVGDLLNRLRDEDARLAELEAGDRSVPSAFHVSYGQLDPTRQRLFRLLGLHPGLDIDARAAAALTESSAREAAQALEELVEVHLLQQTRPNRYQLHDLLRAFARDQAAEAEAASHREQAVRSLLDYYADAVAAAMRMLVGSDVREPRPQRSAVVPRFADRAQCRRWLREEHDNLLAAIGTARQTGQAWFVTWTSDWLRTHFATTNDFAAALVVQRLALQVASENSSDGDRARALCALGDAHLGLAELAEADRLCTAALSAFSSVEDPAGEAMALHSMSVVQWRRGDLHAARELLDAALARHIPGSPLPVPTFARILCGLGHLDNVMGRPERGVERLERCLRVGPSLDTAIQALATFHLGGAQTRLGRYDEAIVAQRRAVGLYRELGDRVGECHAINAIGTALAQAGRLDEALREHDAALTLAWDLGDRNATYEVRYRLGQAYLFNGRPEASLDHLAEAVRVAEELHQEHDTARALACLALAQHRVDRPDDAIHQWGKAVAIYGKLGLTEPAAIAAEVTPRTDRPPAAS